MKKQNIIIIILSIIVFIIDCFIFFNYFGKSKKEKDVVRDVLYTEKFDDLILIFKKYDYTLGGKMLVGVEKSTNGGKDFFRVTEEVTSISEGAIFIFLDKNVGFMLGSENIFYAREPNDFKVTRDGGRTFNNVKFNYSNPNVEILSILNLPYYEDGVLKLDCSIYDFDKESNQYKDFGVKFFSSDQGLTWNVE